VCRILFKIAVLSKEQTTLALGSKITHENLFGAYMNMDMNTDMNMDVDMAPSFTLPDLNGNAVEFNYSEDGSRFSGKVTVMAFFASWCGDCKKELPYFQKLFDKYNGKGDVEFVGVRTWRARENENIDSFVRRYGLKFLILSDTPTDSALYSKVAKLYKINWVPTTFIINKNGEYKQVSAIEDHSRYIEEMSKLIDALM